MTLDDLRASVLQFFGDKSRTPAETREGLLEVAEQCEELAETIPEGE